MDLHDVYTQQIEQSFTVGPCDEQKNAHMTMVDWREGKTPFELCKKSGKWDIYEKLNLSQMGESLKGKSLIF